MKCINYSDIKIEMLNFSRRTYNCLKGNKINTVNELIDLSEETIRCFRNLGKKSLTEINNTLLKLQSADFENNLLKEMNYQNVNDNSITLLDILKESNKKILKVYFYSDNKGILNDLEVDKMNLTKRSLNSLRNNGYNYASEIIKLDLNSFNKIKNLGQKSKDEIIHILKSVIQISYIEETFNDDITTKLSYLLLEDYKQSLIKCDLDILYMNIFSIIESIINIIDVNKKPKELLKEDNFLNLVYKEGSFLLGLLISHILNLLRKSPVEISVIIQTLPSHLKNSCVLRRTIGNLIKSKKLDFYNDKYRLWYPTLNEYILSIDDRDKNIIYNRFLGKTLEETAILLDVTKQRINQLQKRVINQFPRIPLW